MTCLTIRQSQKTEQSLTEALTELVRDESTLLSPQGNQCCALPLSRGVFCQKSIPA
jgi:hypothetical protein